MTSQLSKNQLRIVVLDDEPLVLTGVSLLLESMGHDVTQATHGQEVLDLVRQGQRFDLAILDLTVRNGLGGQEIVEELRAIDSEIQLVVSSGYVGNEVMTDYQRFGFHKRLSKPFSLGDLRELIAVDTSA